MMAINIHQTLMNAKWVDYETQWPNMLTTTVTTKPGQYGLQ